MAKRTVIRNRTRIPVACSSLKSDSWTQIFKGTMRNCSCAGTCIELGHSIRAGNIVMIKATDWSWQNDHSALPEGFRTVALAEVKWSKQLENQTRPRYLMGLRYLPN